MGNHFHMIARLPRSNKARFLQAFDSMVAKLVNLMVPNFAGGKLWARPARCQLLPEAADIEHWVIYCALNPVSSGLTQKYTAYGTFNSFSMAIAGKTQEYKIVDWTAYNNARRTNEKVKPKDYTEKFILTFSRVPGYDHLSHKQYMVMMEKKAEKRRCEIVEERRTAGRGFAGRDVLQKAKPGALPHSTKKGGRRTKRPLILTLSAEARKIHLDIYFRRLKAYALASEAFRDGALTVQFPPGTYRPPLFAP